MNSHSSDVEERVAEPVVESLAAAAAAAGAYTTGNVHERPTLLPPPSDEWPEPEPPPTARWTPPPALIASARLGGADDVRLEELARRATAAWSGR